LSRGQLAQEECMFHNQKQNYRTEQLGDKHIHQNELGLVIIKIAKCKHPK
jgi:hypothetical protein